MNYEEIYNKLRNGDHVSNAELEAIIDHAGSAANALDKLGPTFRLARNELIWIRDSAEIVLITRRNYERNSV